MASREEMLAKLRRADMIAQLQADDKGPTAMETLAEVGRGAVPFYDQLRAGAATAMEHVFEGPNRGQSLGEAYQDFRGISADEGERIAREHPEESQQAQRLGTGLALATGGLGVARTVAAKTAAKTAAKKAAATASKPRIRVQSGQKVKLPAQAEGATKGKGLPTAKQGSVRTPSRLRAAKDLAVGAGEGALVGGLFGNPLAGAVVGGAMKSPLARKGIVKTVKKFAGDDAGYVVQQGMNTANRKWVKQINKARKRRKKHPDDQWSDT